jgi:hypothetical protein
LRREDPSYVIGEPIYETWDSQHSLEELQSTARELGTAGRVGFTRFVEDDPGLIE